MPPPLLYDWEDNFDPYVGTIEMWVCWKGEGFKKPIGPLFFAANGRRSSSATLGDGYLSVNVDCQNVKERFGKWIPVRPRLGAGEWHHVAYQWDEKQFSLFIDGRPVLAFPIKNPEGLLRPVDGIHVAGPPWGIGLFKGSIDEIRISNCVRYPAEFEPSWRKGARPDYAGPGLKEKPSLSHRATRKTTPAVPVAVLHVAGSPSADARKKPTVATSLLALTLDPASGAPEAIAARGTRAVSPRMGLAVFDGRKKRPVEVVKGSTVAKDNTATIRITTASRLGITQTVSARGELLRWDVAVRNGGGEQAWLEVHLGMPVIEPGSRFFDGNSVRDAGRYDLGRTLYRYTLPLAAVFAKQRSLAVFLDPRRKLSYLSSRYSPPKEGDRGLFRQGTRVVVDPGEEIALVWYVADADPQWGLAAVLETFHQAFPDAYRIVRDVDPRMNLGSAGNLTRASAVLDTGAAAFQQADFARRIYAGYEWVWGPHGVEYDYLGTDRFWNRYDWLEDEPEPCRRRYTSILKRYSSLKDMHEKRKAYYHTINTRWLTAPACHSHPNLPYHKIVKEIGPDDFIADPAGQNPYMKTATRTKYTNIYRTPSGEYAKKNYRLFYEQLGGDFGGFALDVTHLGHARCLDPVALKAPGRAWDDEVGVYCAAALGLAEFTEYLMGLPPRPYRKATIPNGGFCTYLQGATTSSALAEEHVGLWQGFGREKTYKAIRRAMGRKPCTVWGWQHSDRIQQRVQVLNPHGTLIRDLYRYLYALRMNQALRYGFYWAPRVANGVELFYQMQPVITEAMLAGYQDVPSAKAPGLWVTRYGKGNATILAMGHEDPKPKRGNATVSLDRIGDDTPLLVEYFGEESPQSVRGGKSVIPFTVPPRRSLVLRGCMTLAGRHDLRAVTSVTGDGIQAALHVELTSPAPVTTAAAIRVPAYYRISAATLDGKPAPVEGATVSLALEERRKHTLIVSLESTLIGGRKGEYANFKFLNEDATANFSVVIPKGSSDVVKGLAWHITEFFRVYQREVKGRSELRVLVPNYFDNREEAAPFLLEEGMPIRGLPVYVNCGSTLDAKGAPVQIASDGSHITIRAKGEKELRAAVLYFLRMMGRIYQYIGLYNVYGFRNFNDPVTAEWQKLANFHGRILIWDDSRYALKEPRADRVEELGTKERLPPVKTVNMEDLYAGLRIRYAPTLFQPVW